MKKSIYIYSVLFIVLLIGCIPQKNIQERSTPELPKTFGMEADTSGFQLIQWRTFFTDTTLIGLIDTALHNNLDMLMTLQKIEAARSNVMLAKGDLFPTVDASVTGAQRKFGLYTMDGAGNITTEITPGQLVPIHLPDFYLGLQASWEVDVWGKLRNKKKAALARFMESIEAKNLVVSNLIAEVANSYYQLLALDNKLEIIQENIKIQESALEMIKIQKLAGAANELAVQQFEIQLLNSKALILEVSLEISIAENRINFLLGRYPQPVKRDKSVLLLPVNSDIKVGLPSDLLQNRPDIRQSEFELMACKADVKAARAAFYPSFTITGSAGFQAFNPSFLFTSPESMVYGLIGSLAAPLINRNAIKAEFNYANATQIEAMYNYQKSILNGYVEVSNQIAIINNLDQIHDLRTEEVNIANSSIDVSNELFKTGNATYLEVLFTQQNSLDSRLSLIEVKTRQYQATIDLYKALGGGWQ